MFLVGEKRVWPHNEEPMGLTTWPWAHGGKYTGGGQKCSSCVRSHPIFSYCFFFQVWLSACFTWPRKWHHCGQNNQHRTNSSQGRRIHFLVKRLIHPKDALWSWSCCCGLVTRVYLPTLLVDCVSKDIILIPIILFVLYWQDFLIALEKNWDYNYTFRCGMITILVWQITST